MACGLEELRSLSLLGCRRLQALPSLPPELLVASRLGCRRLQELPSLPPELLVASRFCGVDERLDLAAFIKLYKLHELAGLPHEWPVASSFCDSDEHSAQFLTGNSQDRAVYTVSKDGKFKVPFDSWSKGKMLGRGSFATVYEGINDTGVVFAVKEVSLVEQGLRAKQCISQLKQEIALLSQFKHENIVQYLGTDQESEKLYIFLELVTQGSLQSIYQKYCLGDSQVRAYTGQILTGLKYLHDRNVMHRDIKCANILVDAHGVIKLADFGLAKETSKLNALKSFQGSAYWMAPEVIIPEKSYWLPADIWSLGCTVLEMLTRRPPNGDLEWHRALWKVGHGEIPPIPNALSSDAKDFIKRCLKIEAADRPSAAELLDHPFVKRSLSADVSTAVPPTKSRHQRPLAR